MAIKSFISKLVFNPRNIVHRQLYSVLAINNKELKNHMVYSKYSNMFMSISNRPFCDHLIEISKIDGFEVSKEKLIKEMNFRSEKDAIPFYTLSLKSLYEIYKSTKNDAKNGFCENRLYYISERIKCPPTTLNKRIVKRLFIYKLSFDWLENSLNVLLDMNVSGDRIQRDLWVLKYHHKTIQERLKHVKDLGVENLYPWMVRCSEDILSRSIELSQETKSILGDNKSTKMYLAARLNTTPDVIEDMYVRIPALKTIRVTKAKKFIDFLIKEGFNEEEIISKSRILAASQNTVKMRLDKLRTLGLNKINLNILCRSRKDFQKYLESIESISKETL